MDQYIVSPVDFELQPLDCNNLSTYECWAQNFFNDPECIQDPYLDITLQLDITAARNRYEAQGEGTFTAFLYYHLIHALKNHPEFFYRFIGEQWVQITNPALFYPIARNDRKNRFHEAFIPNIFQLSWSEFSEIYRTELDCSKRTPRLLGENLFVYTLFIGNLPNLQVTGLTLHTNNRYCAQPYFYFGKRYQHESRLFVSLSIKFHHSTVDPYIIDLLMQDFQRAFM